LKESKKKRKAMIFNRVVIVVFGLKKLSEEKEEGVCVSDEH